MPWHKWVCTHDAPIIFIFMIFPQWFIYTESFKHFYSCRQKNTELTEKEIDKSKKMWNCLKKSKNLEFPIFLFFGRGNRQFSLLCSSRLGKHKNMHAWKRLTHVPYCSLDKQMSLTNASSRRIYVQDENKNVSSNLSIPTIFTLKYTVLAAFQIQVVVYLKKVFFSSISTKQKFK